MSVAQWDMERAFIPLHKLRTVTLTRHHNFFVATMDIAFAPEYEQCLSYLLEHQPIYAIFVEMHFRRWYSAEDEVHSLPVENFEAVDISFSDDVPARWKRVPKYNYLLRTQKVFDNKEIYRFTRFMLHWSPLL